MKTLLLTSMYQKIIYLVERLVLFPDDAFNTIVDLRRNNLCDHDFIYG